MRQAEALSARVQALRLMVAELEAAPGASDAHGAARLLLRFYLGLTREAGSLTGPPLVLRAPGTPRRKYVPKERPLKQALSRNYILAMLREASISEPSGTLSAKQIRERLALEGRRLTRKAVHYHLARLREMGDIASEGGSSRGGRFAEMRWRAVT
jgi:hypothetical protein